MATLVLYAQLKQGVDIFENGHLFEKIVYMFQPARFATLKGTVANFTMGVPLTINGLGFGIAFGLILNLLMMWPLNRWARRRRLDQS
ncbi:MAG: hypothetical protein OFPI_36010 [Osedax symbiont Rs2]|nr:MAG: hypothetical protein OFPI_36010 [Osedax symbiont Rs2]